MNYKKMFYVKSLKINITSLVFKRFISKIKRIELYKKCFLVLGVDENSDQNTVRRAVKKVKKVLSKKSSSR